MRNNLFYYFVIFATIAITLVCAFTSSAQDTTKFTQVYGRWEKDHIEVNFGFFGRPSGGFDIYVKHVDDTVFVDQNKLHRIDSMGRQFNLFEILRADGTIEPVDPWKFYLFQIEARMIDEGGSWPISHTGDYTPIDPNEFRHWLSALASDTNNVVTMANRYNVIKFHRNRDNLLYNHTLFFTADPDSSALNRHRILIEGTPTNLVRYMDRAKETVERFKDIIQDIYVISDTLIQYRYYANHGGASVVVSFANDYIVEVWSYPNRLPK